MAIMDDFTRLDLRVGTIIAAEAFREARIPAIKLQIDFGPLGIKRSSAQITERYDPEQLISRQVVAIVNLPSRRIAGFDSEVLVLGAVPQKGDVVLLSLDDRVADGTPIG